MTSRVAITVGAVWVLGTSFAGAQDIWGTPTSAPPAASETSAPSTGEAEVPAPATPEPHAAVPAGELNPNASYSERILAGLRQIVLRDFDGAIATLRGAAQLEPATPRAFCHLGDAQLGRTDWNEARAAYETCARFAALAKDGRHATLAAVGLARVAELSRQSLAERRDAYVRLEAATSDAAAKTMAAGRLAVLDGLIAMDADYVQVRQRIAERAAAAAAAPSK